jgi:hypothetical protein
MEDGDWLLSSDVTENCSAIVVYISVDPGPQLGDGGKAAVNTSL